jgi:hypothetical protein
MRGATAVNSDGKRRSCPIPKNHFQGGFMKRIFLALLFCILFPVVSMATGPSIGAYPPGATTWPNNVTGSDVDGHHALDVNVLNCSGISAPVCYNATSPVYLNCPREDVFISYDPVDQATLFLPSHVAMFDRGILFAPESVFSNDNAATSSAVLASFVGSTANPDTAAIYAENVSTGERSAAAILTDASINEFSTALILNNIGHGYHIVAQSPYQNQSMETVFDVDHDGVLWAKGYEFGNDRHLGNTCSLILNGTATGTITFDSGGMISCTGPACNCGN